MGGWTLTEWIAVVTAGGTCVTALLTQALLVLRALREIRGSLGAIHDQTNSQLTFLRGEVTRSAEHLQMALLQIARLEERLEGIQRHGNPPRLPDAGC